MKKIDIITAIQAQKARSAWARGVQQTALDMLEPIDDEMLSAKDALNGAETPENWAYGGCGLIYDADIAELLCTPSELRRSKGGKRPPNSHESWLDVYARAAWQAYNLIKAICGENRANDALDLFEF